MMIGYDSYFNQDPSTASQMVLPTPENAREVPCDSCPLFEQCGKDSTECSAFRNWASSGDYKDSDVRRFIRAAK